MTFPFLSTFTNQPSFTTSNSSTSSKADRLAALVADSETRRKVLVVSGALDALRGDPAEVLFVAMA